MRPPARPLLACLSLLVAAPAAAADPHAVADGAALADLSLADAGTTRRARRLTLSGAVPGFLPGLGVEAAYQVADRLALAAQATTLLVHTDLSLRARAFLIAERTWGLYAGPNLHVWIPSFWSILLSDPALVASLEIGYEHRGEGGLTLGIGAGIGWIDVPRGSETENRGWQPAPMLNARLGHSF